MTSTAKVYTDEVLSVLQSASPSPVVEFPLCAPRTARLELSLDNPIVARATCVDNDDIVDLLATALDATGAEFGIGGYNEKRGWYARGAQFAHADEIRSIHLGIDIWAPAGHTVYAPFAGVIHSVQDNAMFGDYGPTIIVEHVLEGVRFYSLYGHLSRESLVGKAPHATIEQGAVLGAIGAPPINGDWPPHLHFQIITDMLGKVGDFPGVAAESERERYLTLCPDPNLVLRSPLLA